MQRPFFPNRFPGARQALILFVASGLAAAAQDELAGDFSLKPAIEQRLTKARADLAALPADAPAKLREQFEQLEAMCGFHAAAAEVLAKAQAERDKALESCRSWQGFPQEPPYELRFADGIRETRANLEDGRHLVEAQGRMIQAEIENARDELERRQREERRLSDTRDPAVDSAGPSRPDTAPVASRVAMENVGRLNLRLAANRAELALVNAKIDLADRQLKAIDGMVGFSRAELDSILAALAAERESATKALTKAGKEGRAVDPLLAWRIEFLDIEKEFWTTRHATFQQTDKSARAKTLAAYEDWQRRLEDWEELGKLRLAGNTEISGIVLDPDSMRDALQRVGRLQHAIAFATAEIEGSRHDSTALRTIGERLHAIWDAELYLAEENVIVDGRKLVTYRAVTVGKVVRLVVILVVGWFLLRIASNFVQRLLAGYTTIPANARVATRRWIFIVGIALLLIYGLNTARIPFTAFAFLGGALAIGVGFGAQTIVKNFIAGLILALERPFRVGDVVEVEGISGTVHSIGLRASVIRSSDGLDSLVPNSDLLEKKLTNWTLTDTRIRHSITIAVPNSTPSRDIVRLLRSVADNHGLVLATPEPEVRLDGWSNENSVFRLLYWFDVRQTARDRLASDLRLMTEAALEQAGIPLTAAKPDISFSPQSPLRVEFSRQAPAATDRCTDPSPANPPPDPATPTTK